MRFAVGRVACFVGSFFAGVRTTTLGVTAFFAVRFFAGAVGATRFVVGLAVGLGLVVGVAGGVALVRAGAGVGARGFATGGVTAGVVAFDARLGGGAY